MWKDSANDLLLTLQTELMADRYPSMAEQLNFLSRKRWSRKSALCPTEAWIGSISRSLHQRENICHLEQ